MSAFVGLNILDKILLIHIKLLRGEGGVKYAKLNH